MNKATSTPLERLAAVLLLLLFGMVLLEVAIVILVTGGRPILVTRPGNRLQRYGFRTTNDGLTEFSHVSRFLRKYRIDRLPALWNVVRGELPLRDVLLA